MRREKGERQLYLCYPHVTDIAAGYSDLRHAKSVSNVSVGVSDTHVTRTYQPRICPKCGSEFEVTFDSGFRVVDVCKKCG